jgi:hypothetical protein
VKPGSVARRSTAEPEQQFGRFRRFEQAQELGLPVVARLLHESLRFRVGKRVPKAIRELVQPPRLLTMLFAQHLSPGGVGTKHAVIAAHAQPFAAFTHEARAVGAATRHHLEDDEACAGEQLWERVLLKHGGASSGYAEVERRQADLLRNERWPGPRGKTTKGLRGADAGEVAAGSEARWWRTAQPIDATRRAPKLVVDDGGVALLVALRHGAESRGPGSSGPFRALSRRVVLVAPRCRAASRAIRSQSPRGSRGHGRFRRRPGE